MPFIKTNSGLNWHFHSRGEGEPVLFIHGWSFDGSIWLKQIDDFLSSYRVVILDLPGHGHSDYKKETDLIKDISFIVRELNLGKVNLVGHSFGGFLSLKLALQYPELIKNLVLIGAPAKFMSSKDYSFGLREKEISKLRSFLLEDYPDILLVFMRWLFTAQERKRKEFREVWNVLSKRKIWPQKEAMADFLSIIEKDEVRENLKGLKIPTLIISGESDPICRAESMHYLGEQIKNSKVELFKGCGHLPFLTKFEEFNSLVKGFLG